MKTLRNNPTNSELDFLIEAHARVGYLASVAEGEADMVSAMRKHEQASAFKEAMSSNTKMSASAAERHAELAVWELKVKEVDARTKATKINNLYRSVTEAINGVKYLGRIAG